jgi:peptidoglycan/LPS O-acetylase OafA/YrhL
MLDRGSFLVRRRRVRLPGLRRQGFGPAAGGGRLRALDALRLVAALMVAFYHYLGIDTAGAPTNAWGQRPQTVFPATTVWAPYGWLGVEVFFIISGFVICMSCWGKTLGDFFRSRVTRLYPAYWAGVLLTFVGISLTPAVVGPPSIADAITNLTMLQDAVGADRVDGVYWTLWTELRFYLLFALVVWHGLTFRRVIAFCLVWTLAAALADAGDLEILELVAMPDNANYFILGVGLYLVHRFGHQLLTWLVIGANAALSLHSAVERMHHQAEDVVHQPLKAWVVGLVLLTAVLLILAIARGHLSWVSWRWVTLAGALTYPFYLVHDRIGRALIYWMYVRGEWSAYVVLPTVLAAMLTLAWLIHRMVEKPVSRWLRQRLSSESALSLDPRDLLSRPRNEAADRHPVAPTPASAVGAPTSTEPFVTETSRECDTVPPHAAST